MKFWLGMQKIMLRVEQTIHPFYKWLFSLVGVSRYFVLRDEVGNEAEELMCHVSDILKDAKDVKVMLGEGDTLVLRWLALPLARAFEWNNTIIEMLRGPRFHPSSWRMISKLLEDGVLTLFENRYFRHHFVIITTFDDRVFVVDERIHTEAIWRKTDSGQPDPVYVSAYRLFYIFENPILTVWFQWLYAKRRKSAAASSFSESPGFVSEFPYPPWVKVGASIALNFPERYILQPLAIFMASLIYMLYRVSVRFIVPNQRGATMKERVSRPKRRGRYVVESVESDPDTPGIHIANMRLDPEAMSFDEGRVVVPKDSLHPDIRKIFREGTGWLVDLLDQEAETQG